MQHSTCRRPLSILLAVISLGFSFAAPAAAQLSRVGATTPVIPVFARGNDAAHDPINRVYMVVGGNGGLQGAFINEAGVPLTGMFAINDPNFYAQYPRVIYSPEVNGTGGFLVVWNSADFANGANQIHARTFSYGGAAGADTVIGFSQPLGSFWEMAPAGAFSTTSHAFLIAWKTFGTDRIDGVRVSPSGQPIGGLFQISNPGEYSRDPGVAWNPNTDEFGVSMSGVDNLGASASFTRVRASDGALLGRTIVEHNAGSYITDVTFNSASNTFVMGWWTGTSRTARLDASGNFLGYGTTASAVGRYDGLSVAYNPISGTILMVGTYTYEVGAVELNGAGAKIGAEQEVTVAGAFPQANPIGSYYPRVTSNKLTKTWDVTFSLGFGSAASQIIATGSVGPPPTDTDGDGVPDSVDQCPTVFAQTANGCPAPPPVDTDGDGVLDSADPCPLVYAATPNGCPIQAPMSANFSGQGGPQIVFVNKSTGGAYLWTMSNAQYTGGGWLWPGDANDPAWRVVGTADLTGDGRSDLLWQNQQTGAVRLYRMAFYSKIGEQTVGLQVGDPNWRIVATADFNNDGQADILWQHTVAGNFVIWFMKGVNDVATFQSAAYITANGTAVALGNAPWRVVGTSDFDFDGYRDIAFENTATGEMNIWGLGARTQGGVPVIRQMTLGAVSPDWQIKAIANYAGDGSDDALFQSTSTGALYLWIRSGNGFVPYGFLSSPNPIWEASGPK